MIEIEKIVPKETTDVTVQGEGTTTENNKENEVGLCNASVEHEIKD